MNQTNETLEGIKTRVGIIRGMRVKAGTGRAVDIEWGICRVGTVTDDATVANKAALGYNQPGTKFEVAAAATIVTVAASSTKLVWLRADGVTYAMTADTTDGTYTDVAPDLGPDPFRGTFLPHALSDNNLRSRPIASLLLAKVTTDGSNVTAVDNTVAPLALV